ncbi:flagellar basal-body MS-ring/collar protein FliF [Dickeya chrysanthemi]|uniref:flagellar basal-body MS-ring/collar protein FliF n=1 Tax=Dickeya TaxID=204037 RepID=UPI00117EA6FC|nr:MULTISPECIES: flagellar basal-body MS-ring/collar protein FliF [Dickeya]TYL43542.1 flagellar basal body M-ring protein FliF [Dickeya sp. ws52]WJM86117.1 flagellar basal-body MS-ring/collar protein FliF [Dickeya chrysanthemi]
MNALTSGAATGGKSFGEILDRLRANPRIPLLIAAAATIAIVVALSLWARGPDYRVLYTNLNERDGGSIVSELGKMNIPYRFTESGAAIMIPADKVYETRLKLAQQGLPKGGAVGFELLDQEKFGISQFSEQINYQRALEGELARTMETLGPIQNARVHLAIPKPSLFVREQKSPSAAVTVTLQPGRALDDSQINAITYLVSSSVAGLPADKVTVVDQTGKLLTQNDGSGRDLNAAQLKYANEIEGNYQRRIEAILAPVVGAGNVHAQVTAQIDFANREQTDEQYQPNQSPNQSAVRSQQSSQSDQRGGSNVGGVPGALSNTPSPAPTAPISTPPANNANNTNNTNNTNTAGTNTQTSGNNAANQTYNSRHDQTINYEVDRTIRHTKQSTGNIQRLSVAVVVNYTQGEDGKPAALSDEQLKKIEALVRESMGFSTERGDSLNVVNTPFTITDTSGGELPFWQKQVFFDLLTAAGRWLLVLIVGWILYRKLVRPQLQRRVQIQEAAAAAAALRGQDPDVSVTISSMEEELQKKSEQRAHTEMHSQRIRELAENDPRVVALVIRHWMSNEL